MSPAHPGDGDRSGFFASSAGRPGHSAGQQGGQQVGHHASDTNESEEREPVVIRDNRKIDREPAAADTAETGTDDAPDADASEALVAAATQLAEERTRDLQRLQAEYANYRKRSERDRLAAGDIGVGRAVTEMLPVLDDLDRARAHGDLSGPLKAVADKLETAFTKLGVEAFGAVGDAFDPAIHEAVTHDESDDVSVATTTTIMRPGYRLHERLLRPAMVGVSDPTDPGNPTAVAVDAELVDEGPVGENEVRDGEPADRDA